MTKDVQLERREVDPYLWTAEVDGSYYPEE